MATERKVDKLARPGSIGAALKKRRMAIEEGNLEDASNEYNKELMKDEEEKRKRRRKLGIE